MRLNIKQMASSLLLLGLCLLSLAGGAAAPAAGAGQKPRPEAALAAAPKATWIAQGQGRRKLYVFFDPNCTYCPLLYKNLQPLIAPYDLQLRWIPVAMLDPTSLGKAAAILQAKDPKAALDENEGHFTPGTHAGSIAEDIPADGTEALLRANEALLHQVGIPVVPTMLFQAKSGEAMVVQGALSPVALRKVLDRIR